MIRSFALPTIVAVLFWLGIFNVLRHLAIRALVRDGRGEYVALFLSGAWWKGGTPEAGRWRTAAIVWLIVVPIAAILVMAIAHFGR